VTFDAFTTGLNRETSIPRPADRRQSAGQQGFSILLLEQHEVARRGLHEMLSELRREGLVADVRSTNSVAGGLAVLERYRPDVLVLSPDLDGVGDELLVDALEGALVLVLVRSEEPGHLEAAAHTAFNGFLLEQDLTVDGLANALQQLGRGEIPMPPALVRHLLGDTPSRGVASGRPLLLTSREHQVLHLLVDGLSNKQIAGELCISTHGAKRHVANVLMKLNCPNRTTAVARALNEGFLTTAIARA
jgi:two-component system nitrate/nitrite response regulator NarL